ncbi:Cytochrome P450 [Metarhizium anisopliae]|nr:Cytochrome P450 [Metarhizium anisopliae]
MCINANSQASASPVPFSARRRLRIVPILPVGDGPDRKSPVLIPKGSPVAFSVYTLHHRPDLYGMDAKCFRPERDSMRTCLSLRTRPLMTVDIYRLAVDREFGWEVRFSAI